MKLEKTLNFSKKFAKQKLGEFYSSHLRQRQAVINAGNDFVDSDDEEHGKKVIVFQEQRDQEDEF
jgi:hypothetical protein